MMSFIKIICDCFLVVAISCITITVGSAIVDPIAKQLERIANFLERIDFVDETDDSGEE